MPYAFETIFGLGDRRFKTLAEANRERMKTKNPNALNIVEINKYGEQGKYYLASDLNKKKMRSVS